jgi:RNA polymerase-binding transcription factor DksA
MTSPNMDSFRQKLESLASRVRSDASSLLEQTRTASGGNGGGNLSNVPLHLGDMGTDAQLYDMNTALLENEQYIAAEAREALQRFDGGTYGVCEGCGQPIAKARLEAIPYARHCVRCAEANDLTPQVNLNHGRPATPADTLAPEGEMQEDRRAPEHAVDPRPRQVPHSDIHAAGTAGGGTAVGGLAGTNEGHGDPNISELQEASGSGDFDIRDDRLQPNTPLGGPSGGAVGGTPARKRTR